MTTATLTATPTQSTLSLSVCFMLLGCFQANIDLDYNSVSRIILQSA